MAETKHGGPIDPHSQYNLHDVLENEMPAGETTEFYGFHLTNDGGTGYRVQPNDHAGALDTLHATDYDDILELVADLMALWIEWDTYSLDTKVEEAGKVLTTDPELVEQSPEIYQYTQNTVEVDG